MNRLYFKCITNKMPKYLVFICSGNHTNLFFHLNIDSRNLPLEEYTAALPK
jgi:hypothetical protein